ncbi:GH25 family lysozyme [Clostridium hydrogenum]|uniref:GH25 family lysozyme n=1 Tax=Clostridium hydrogenum TaxID=2855764 RepID=UPI001F21858F|nr:GH25 family lysozyme [Clostridium hydrogenum]
MYQGIDVFSGTNVTNWSSVKNSGIQMVYIKATEGVSYTNPLMNSQYNGAKAAGILVGFYHFASTNSPTAEYNYFMNAISGYGQDLKPCLDYEIDNADYSFINQFMAQNSNLIFYGSHSIADNTGLALNKIWIAEPGTSPSGTNGYAGIQYSWYGQVDGISGDVDRDCFDSIVLSGNVQPTPTDNSVAQIQQKLNTLLKLGLVVDGIQGPLTTSGIEEFQGIMGLTEDGIWGSMTEGASDQIFSRPTDGVAYPHYEYATRYIQFRCGSSVDGTFGSITESYVESWQSNHGRTADGIVGPATWSMLLDENV